VTDWSTVQVVLVVTVSLACAVAFDWLTLAWLWRLKKGAFEVTRDDVSAFSVRTDHGHFAIVRSARDLRATAAGVTVDLPLDHIQRIDLSYREEASFWQEWFRGLDLWDLCRRYGDTIQWYEVSIVADGRRIPFFVAGQYVPREPLSAWYLEFQASTLSRMGFFQDVREKAGEVVERLQDALRESGWSGPMPADRGRKSGVVEQGVEADEAR
jgi:hypothetical protein